MQVVKNKAMEVRNAKIAEAAIAVVTRYGLRKTTMGDLATAAGVSRQTLYNAYDNKDDVIRDAIRYVTSQGIAKVQSAWADAPDLAAKLDIFMTAGPLAWYDWIASTPDAADLVDGLYRTGQAEMAEGSERWAEALAAIFAPYDDQLALRNQTPQMLGTFVYQTAHSAKSGAIDRADLKVRLATLQASVLALAGEV